MSAIKVNFVLLAEAISDIQTSVNSYEKKKIFMKDTRSTITANNKGMHAYGDAMQNYSQLKSNLTMEVAKMRSAADLLKAKDESAGRFFTE